MSGNRKAKKNKGRKSKATELAHRKFRWLKQLSADPLIPLLALRACMVVCDHASLDHNGQAIIGQGTIAKKLGVWRQQVSSALRQAVALGHLEVIRRGRDHANAYRMVLKDEVQAAADDDVGKSPTSKAPKPPHDVCDSQTSSMSRNADIKPDMMSANPDFDVCDSQTDSPFFSPGAPTEPPGRERVERKKEKRERPAFAGEAQPAGTPPLTRDPAEEAAAKESKKSSFSTAAPSPGPESPTERSPSVEREERFRDLRAQWKRPWPDDVEADRRAFMRTCQEVAPEDIVARAMVWAAEVEPRFLPPLAKWLANRGWEKPPPTKAKRAANGAHRPGRKANLADIAADLARQYEAERDGS
jgi:hypothetical protein